MDDPALARAYQGARPFPHIVLDGVFPLGRVKAAADEMQAAVMDLGGPEHGHVAKRWCSDPKKFPPKTRELIEELNSPAFIARLEKLTGIKGLEPDPYFSGGGIHQIGPGGLLRIHTDFNWHEQLQLHRRINLLLYLNEGWNEAWGGNLELWHEADVGDPNGEAAVSVAPLINRMVIFSTTDHSYHGHPQELTCPPDRTRNSIALYYYSRERPADEVQFAKNRMANFVARPGEDLGWEHWRVQAEIRSPAYRAMVRTYRGFRKLFRPLKKMWVKLATALIGLEALAVGLVYWAKFGGWLEAIGWGALSFIILSFVMILAARSDRL